MSYILQLFAADDIATTADAAALLNRSAALRPPEPGAFGRFRAELESAWPGAGRDPALPEGLESPRDGDPVWGLAVRSSKVDDNLLRHIGRAAARAGLHVFDPQAGILLRCDGILVNSNGETRKLDAPSPWRSVPPAVAELTAEQARHQVAERAEQRFARAGFSSVRDAQWLQFQRHVGDVQQCIELTVAESVGVKGRISLHLGIQFHCPRVRDVWIRQFGARVAAHVASDRRRPPPEFTLYADQIEDVPSALSETLGGRKFEFASTIEQIAAWWERVAHWIDAAGDRALERASSVSGLAHYVLHPQQMRWLYLNNNLSIDEILSRLVIVAAFERDRLDEWTAAFRDHRRRKGRDPLFGKDLFVPNRTAVLDDLLTYLRSDAFLEEALRLKA